jgi:hypothetical protein
MITYLYFKNIKQGLLKNTTACEYFCRSKKQTILPVSEEWSYGEYWKIHLNYMIYL